jgi:hypothetical protein
MRQLLAILPLLLLRQEGWDSSQQNVLQLLLSFSVDNRPKVLITRIDVIHGVLWLLTVIRSGRRLRRV